MNAIKLSKEELKHKISKCIICQKDQPKVKLSSSKEGSEVLRRSIKKLGDNYLNGLTETERDEIKYHSRSCYSSYKLTAERKENERATESTADTNVPGTLPETPGSSCKKNQPRGTSPLASPPCSQKEKPCVICRQLKYKKDTKKYCICEVQCAKNFIKAYNFNRDEVCEKCILYKTPGDIFATDIHAHKNCNKRYIKKHLDDVQEFLQTFDDAEKEGAKASEVQVAIDELRSSLDLETKGYVVSLCRNQVNAVLADSGYFLFPRIVAMKSKLITLCKGPKIYFYLH